MPCLRSILLTILVGFTLFGFSQNSTPNSLKVLDQLLTEEDYKSAQAFSKKHIDSLLFIKAFYEATDYIYYIGTIETKLNGNSKAISRIATLENKIKTLTNNPKDLRQLALEIGSFYESIGDSKTACDYNIKALEYTKKMPKATAKDFALIQSNLGVFFSRLGDIPMATKYHKKALKNLQTDSKSSGESYYITYNALGGMMWYASKFDSAIVYFQKADKILRSLEQNPMNKLFRPASLNNNIAGIYSIQGKLNEALASMQITVKNLTAFLKEDISNARRADATEFLFQAIDNYAGLYKEVGDYKKARQLIQYAYEQKKRHLNGTSPEISKGKILLGQINLPLKNYKEAETLLDEGISDFKSFSGNYTQWLADAYYRKALLNFEIENFENANTYFELSESYFKASLGDYYDEVYLDFIVNASLFYAKTGNKTKAISMATEALNYIRENQGSKTLLEYHQLLNLAKIHFLLENFNETLQLADEALTLLNSDGFVKTIAINKQQIESYKVPAILLKVKTQQKLSNVKDEQFLLKQLNALKIALKLLDQQKSIIAENHSTSILIQDNIELFQLAKQISLELYQLTQNETYLHDLLSFHESITYHNIRKRLNSKSAVLTASLPFEILAEEKRLKQQLNHFSSADGDFDTYLQYENEWDTHLNKLQSNFPDYYKLMYATIHSPLQQIKSKIPALSTVLRYLYVDNNLYAVLISPTKIDLVPIKTEGLTEKVQEFNSKIETLDSTFQLQYELYQTLWEPIFHKLKTSKVVIIPDKELFNLSFETLTSKLIKSHSEITEHSLLANYNLSYNYSLFLIDKNSKPVNYKSNFVAFAPEFSESMKRDYKIAIEDSLSIDYTYLRLLPQPFATDLAKNYSRFFDGNSFLNENASKQIFTSKAREHKIIHIGTHAESDNVSPEFSRLIFAKKNDENDNSLYTYEIYNQNLSSNLAILTACETGKPTFQPGEGMISLAHAFNYAGSESILTSLWNIDEQSSAEVIKYFYNYIADGLTKDEALKQAKLSYIAKAKGRTAAPQYWAGLVLIGDTAPIDIETSVPIIYWIIAVVIIFIILILLRNKFSKQLKTHNL